MLLKNLANAISRHSRRKKMQVLLPLVREASSILDVGAGRGEFLYQDLPTGWSGRIVALDKRQELLDVLKRRFPFVETRIEDATAMPFGDGEFDLVVCNAMLEHVPEIATSVAREIRRVGKRYYAAVPYRYSVFEAHYYLPFLGSLPPKQFHRLVCLLFRSRLYADPVHLLTRREMCQFFPDSRVFMIHAACGLFSSVVAIK